MTKQSLTVIIPCYNEELMIEKTYQRVKHVFSSLSEVDACIIFINDGSSDKTSEKLNNIASQDSIVKLIHFSRNFGHQAAVTAGINNTNTDIAIIIDADLQDPPSVILDFLKEWDKGFKVVVGVRRNRKENWFNNN
jgi:dolichol-phosphate mannosyltransferase